MFFGRTLGATQKHFLQKFNEDSPVLFTSLKEKPSPWSKQCSISSHRHDADSWSNPCLLRNMPVRPALVLLCLDVLFRTCHSSFATSLPLRNGWTLRCFLPRT